MPGTLDLPGCAGAGAVRARLLALPGAPDWHGADLDALRDGLTGGLFPKPATVAVTGRGSPEAEAEGARIAAVLAEAGVALRRGGARLRPRRDSRRGFFKVNKGSRHFRSVVSA
jgi:hypothetical protein